MKYCSHCGTKVSEDALFCVDCGRQLSIVQDTQLGSKRRLTEAVARQLRSAYCARCGSLLQVRKLRQNGFDEGTGYPKYDIILACPHAAVYETDISREVRFMWKSPFDRHTVRKVSKIIELDSDIADSC